VGRAVSRLSHLPATLYPYPPLIDDFLGFESGSTLARFTRDLTADARAGRLEPVRCREREINRVIDILLRHGKNNPTLVGPSGAGKTAIVDGLAQRIGAGTVPVALRDVRVLSLDHVGLLAGTHYRGQYEGRVRSLVAETMQAGNIILFIDELHNLIGQGSGDGVAMDAANMLKPSLVRGDFRVIGATTNEEYTRWIEGDPALARRFQKIVVKELDDAATLEILQARKERLERHHNVMISDDALHAAIKLTDRYITDRLRPDKAIDAIDEACAHMQAEITYTPQTEALIRERLRLARNEAAKMGAEASARSKGGSQRATGRRETAPPPDESQPGADSFDGFSALERFGAELEAIFVGPPPPKSGGASATGTTTRTESAQAPSAPSSPPPPPARTLATVEAELGRRLMEEGVVVRGHDIARVVELMAGMAVSWEPSL
jgi:ATP-dependent Clp protease ATP-binding subunit ClpA